MKSNDSAWVEVRRRCRLSDDEVRMAKELGFQPKSLLKNIPSPQQQWKMPVKDWVRSLYEEKIGKRRPAGPSPDLQPRPKGVELRNAEYPWPDRPEIPELVIEEPDGLPHWGEGGWGFDGSFEDRFEPPSEGRIQEQTILALRQQCLFRWAAQWVATAVSRLPEVQKVAAFGAVARPLRIQVPRFGEFRRHRIEVPHECADLDLALWMSDLARLRELKNSIREGLTFVEGTLYGGVADHQLDIHLFEAGTDEYRGRLCAFGQCPKPKKRECMVPGCGQQPFLQQFSNYRFNRPQFEGELKVILFDRAAGFVVNTPRMDAKPTRFVQSTGAGGVDRDEDVPF